MYLYPIYQTSIQLSSSFFEKENKRKENFRLCVEFLKMNCVNRRIAWRGCILSLIFPFTPFWCVGWLVSSVEWKVLSKKVFYIYLLNLETRASFKSAKTRHFMIVSNKLIFNFYRRNKRIAFLLFDCF